MLNKYNTILLIVIFFKLSFFSQKELKYKYNQNDPNWIKLMYSKKPDPDKLIKAYNRFYNKKIYSK